MIRPGFIISFNEKWLGGLNYYKNLLWAIYDYCSGDIEPVLFTTPDADSKLISSYPPFKVIKSKYVGENGIVKKIDNGIGYLLGVTPYRAITNSRILRNENIDILSHSHVWGLNLPTLPWIADFQYYHYPHFFLDKIRQRLMMTHRRIGKKCKNLVLSSTDAVNDFKKVCPDATIKIWRLPFAVKVPCENDIAPLNEIKEKYKLDRPYYILPNQFWKHKNHMVVLRALKYLSSKGKKPPLVVCTGHCNDNRNPGYFETLMNYVKSNDIKNFIRFCGIIPIQELYGLMRYSKGLINPSLFEGWSTTVEEAKMFGLQMILSDIPLHREQAGENASYFDPRSPEECAELIINENNSLLSDLATEKAFSGYEKKRCLFAQAYADILTRIISTVTIADIN